MFVDNPPDANDLELVGALASHIASRVLALDAVLDRTMYDATVNAVNSLRRLFMDYDGPILK